MDMQEIIFALSSDLTGIYSADTNCSTQLIYANVKPLIIFSQFGNEWFNQYTKF